MDYLTRIWLFNVYLSQEGEGGGGGEMEHIYNHPKGGLVPPPKEGLWGGGFMGSLFFFSIQGCWTFVTAILAIEYGFTVYFFVGGVLDMRTGRSEGPFFS